MTDRLRYTDHTKPVDTTPPKVDVAMIQVRPDDHVWVREAKQSVQAQSYPHLGMLVVDNQDRALTIGNAWNACVQASDADLIFFLGDDDGLVPDLIACMVDGFSHMRKQAPNLVHLTTQCTVLDESAGAAAALKVTHTGMFLRQFLVEHPFDEQLSKDVGLDKVNAIGQAQKLVGQPMSMAILHHYGYIWRQHPWMNNGRPMSLKQQAHGRR